MLGRIWEEIRDDPEPMHVISELDFIAYDDFYRFMHDVLIQGALAVVPYSTRAPDGVLLEHGGLSGAWLLGINKELFKSEPPLDWLGAGGPFNDAANLAVKNLGDLVNEDDVLWLDYTDDFPQSVGLEYQLLGYHAFFNRHFDDPPDTPLFNGYTIGDHLQDIVARLDALEA